MSGNGTMPTVTLESPLDRDQFGSVIMNFGEASIRGYFHSAVGKVG